MTDFQARWEAAQIEYRSRVRTFARNSYYRMPSFSAEDVEQELLVVLWECVVHYDPSNGAKFNTYFQTCAKRRIITLIRHFDAIKRKAELVSLTREEVKLAVDMFISEQSAEQRALDRMQIQEYVSVHGIDALMKPRRRKRVA